jgi:hypothetical protein
MFEDSSHFSLISNYKSKLFYQFYCQLNLKIKLTSPFKISEPKSYAFQGQTSDKVRRIVSWKIKRPILSYYFKNNSSFDEMERTPVEIKSIFTVKGRPYSTMRCDKVLRDPQDFYQGHPNGI